MAILAIGGNALATIRSMVALAPNTSETSAWDVHDAFPKLHSRAREAKTTPCTEVPMLKSRNCIEMWLTIYETCDRLESFTRDTIGYGGDANMYTLVSNAPLTFVDPTGLCAVACQCLSSERTFKDIIDEILKKLDPLAVGGSIPTIFDANGNGDHTKCKAARWRLDYMDSTEKGKKVIDVHEKIWTPDRPDFGGYAKWHQLGQVWRFVDIDAPTFGLQKQFWPGKKIATYIEYVVDSDGTINPLCCHQYRIQISIDKNGKVSSRSDYMMLSPPCHVKAKELEANNTTAKTGPYFGN